MDPITVAGAYATIVGLICAFKNERKGLENQTKELFLSYLETQHREDLKEFILRTTELPSEIDRLLKEDTETILQKLNELRDSVVSLPSRIDNVKELIQSAQPRSERIGMLPHLIAEAERAVRQIEKEALILLRTETERDWDLPVDVEALKEAYERFRSMDLQDTLDHTFVIEECASYRRTLTIHKEGRLRQRERLLKALQKLIALREEFEYLEQETRTPWR